MASIPTKSRRCRINHPAQIRVALLVLAATSLGILSGCRQDMHNQPKFIPLRSSEFYSDHRSARYPVPGTVPRFADDPALDQEQLDPGSYYLSGKHGNVFGNELPAQITFNVQLLERGQDRFNIFCAPCHSRVGDGNGMIVQRGYKRPPSFHDQRLRNAPLGHIFDVISNGFGAMPDYAAQVKPADRWAIATYIRVLQRSQNASEADVLPADKDKLKTPEEDGPQTPDTSQKPSAPSSQPLPQGGVKP
jgi:mono/diheme cytochrome c family protein